MRLAMCTTALWGETGRCSALSVFTKRMRCRAGPASAPGTGPVRATPLPAGGADIHPHPKRGGAARRARRLFPTRRGRGALHFPPGRGGSLGFALLFPTGRPARPPLPVHLLRGQRCCSSPSQSLVSTIPSHPLTLTPTPARPAALVLRSLPTLALPAHHCLVSARRPPALVVPRLASAARAMGFPERYALNTPATDVNRLPRAPSPVAIWVTRMLLALAVCALSMCVLVTSIITVKVRPLFLRRPALAADTRFSGMMIASPSSNPHGARLYSSLSWVCSRPSFTLATTLSFRLRPSSIQATFSTPCWM